MVNDTPEITIELETVEVKDNRTWFQKLRMKLPWSRWKRSERKIMKALDNVEMEHSHTTR